MTMRGAVQASRNGEVRTISSAAEAEIHAAAQQIAFQRHAVVGDDAALKPQFMLPRSRGDIRLGGPIVGQRELDAAAGRPAALVWVLRKARRRGLDVANREAAVT